MKISLVINCDTRPERSSQDGLFNGTVNLDFMDEGVLNKIKFFSGFDIETIIFIDKHQEIPEETLSFLYQHCDTVVIRKHTHEEKFNDYNYLAALSMARGEIICHFDQDVCAFTNGKEPIERMISWLDKYDYVSYPSRWSPNPVHDPKYDYYWCSTRFFMCKRETLDFTEIKKCLMDSDYLYGKYPASIRNPWTEHIIALLSKYNGKGVFYPPFDLNNYCVFTWGKYEKWILRRLNNYSYTEVLEWINNHPLTPPNNDVYC